ncbi:hypothetical protein AU255_14115 [Methyloprofundus sedimenti]|uniref:Uncharacterized protein n=1 Tax=Methyloprofundus sedimenti TaxID=1420851 RepID=A0A1V8M3T7_9GAMM|nr:hypothetical protein [Methyloprofundus sedimenti]OQK16229.1 hypothetical protein AU255_14115 [Methyloprofundus sedimenti]
MFILLRAILYCIGIPAVIVAILVIFSTSNKDLTLPEWELTSADIQRAKSILHANQNDLDKPLSMYLTERDLNIASAYLLNVYTGTQSQIKLHENYILFILRFTLPENIFGRYLDIQFQLHTPDTRPPEISKLRVGKIIIPDAYAGLLIDTAIEHTRVNKYLQLIRQDLKVFRIQDNQLHLVYQSPTTASSNIQQLMTPKDNNQAQDQYQQKLDQAIREHDPDWRLSLSDVLRPLFELARQRSTAKNAIEENRLAIIVANRYVNNYPNAGAHGQNNPNPKYSVFLYKRIDMAQHFMWSATFSAMGNSHLADMLGIEKELSDAKKGSGFSFIDLAADRAGMKFGKQATASPEQALQMQEKMANIENYQAFMPDIRDLPESLSSQTFTAQYQSIQSAEYQRVLDDIDRRIAECDIYKAAAQ